MPQSILYYYNKQFSIGGFVIKLTQLGQEQDFYMPMTFNAFLSVPKDEFDFEVIVKDQESFTPSEKINEFVFSEGESYIMDYNFPGIYHIAYRIKEDWSSFSLLCNEVTVMPYMLKWTRYLGYCFSYGILKRDAIMLHAVIMEYQGMGILLSAKSGTGKTTHGHLWRDHKGALIINGDRALCRRQEGKWYAYGSPWSGSSGECINRRVPIKAIVFLEQHPDNIVCTLKPEEAIMALIERAFAPNWNRDLMNKALDVIGAMVSDIPCYKLKCRPDMDSVEVLEKYIL